jgi:glutaredoxin-related protein
MKGNPQAPQCGFSNTAVRVLQVRFLTLLSATFLCDLARNWR